MGLIAEQKRPCACPETQVDSGDGLPVPAEPGLTQDILVSCTSVRPKACNQVTGRCKGGGFESIPTNKLHMSTPGERKFSQKLMGLEACNLPIALKIFYAKHSNRKEPPDSGGKPGTVAPGRTGLQESCRLLKRKRTRMTICTYNARTLSSEAAIGHLMMQAKKIKHVIGLTETRRRHSLNTVYETGEELFLGTCDSRGVGGVGVLVNTSMAKNIDSFEQRTTPIGHLRMRRCGPTPALTIFGLRSNIKLRRRSRRFLYRPGEVLPRRSFLLLGHIWRFQRQSWPKKNA